MTDDPDEKAVQKVDGEQLPQEATGRLDIARVLDKAVETGADVEQLERLADLYERMQERQAQQAFVAAMTEFQRECPIIVKDKKVSTGSYDYHYAPLDSIVRQTRDLLQKHGLSYQVDTEATEDGIAVTVTATHLQGHSESSTVEVPVDKAGGKNAIQSVASAKTYATRYAFCDVFGIITGSEDDDAQNAGSAKIDEVHQLGGRLYQDDWAEKRPQLVEHVTDGACSNVADMELAQLDRLLNALQERVTYVRQAEVNPTANGYEIVSGDETTLVLERGDVIECQCCEREMPKEDTLEWCLHARTALEGLRDGDAERDLSGMEASGEGDSELFEQ